MKRKILICSLMVVLLVGFGVATVPEATREATAQFVLSAYTYDETTDGHYIAYIQGYYDGALNATMYYNPTSYPNDTAISTLETFVGTNVTIAVFCWLNGTSAGIASLSEGLNVIRHNMTVINTNGTTVFSKQNFTYNTGLDSYAPMYFYRHDVYLNFTFVLGEIYQVIITYEVYY